MILYFLFWFFFFILIYTYVGYPLLLRLIVGVKRLFSTEKSICYPNYEPAVCLFVTAYNEKDYVHQKVANSFALDYPKEKVQYVWVTDGSSDETPELLRKYDGLEVFHQSERRGKMHAMNRGMQFVNAPIIIFSDTNTLLNRECIREIVACFSDSSVGCVAGEKRIAQKEAEDAAAAGEGLYWKYESWVKRMDAELNSAVGAVGELFAIRSELFEPVETDTILDDFIISLRIAQKGYKIAYVPNAYAEETASLNVTEELKRKIRIAAGGVQTLFRLKSLLNPFKNGILTWQYLSHKVLRWTLAPISLFLVFFLNLLIVLYCPEGKSDALYVIMLILQLMCYMFALIGWYFENRKIRFKLLFVPYYFVSINYAALLGMKRFFQGKQSARWEKSKRASLL